MGANTFINRDGAGRPLGFTIVRRSGAITLLAASRDTFSLTILQRGVRPVRRLLSRRGAEGVLVMAAIAGAPP